MTQFLQLASDGFALGCVYALVALGFAVVYRASQVINFAQGAMLLVGAYLVSLFAAYAGLPFWFAVSSLSRFSPPVACCSRCSCCAAPSGSRCSRS